MNRAAGVVERVRDGFAWVRIDPAAGACGGCGQRRVCPSAADSSQLTGRPARLLRLANAINARPGDAVEVCVNDGVLWRAAWRVWLLPLLLALAGALLGGGVSELAAVVGMLLGLGGGWFWLRSRHRSGAGGEPILSMDFKRST